MPNNEVAAIEPKNNVKESIFARLKWNKGNKFQEREWIYFNFIFDLSSTCIKHIITLQQRNTKFEHHNFF